jgi:hypothetical protein
MKVCPICDTKFDEDVIRFCTKDGTPLVDAEGPSFAHLPSDDVDGPEDETGEITVVRRKETVPPPPSIDELNRSVPLTAPFTERIVIPTTDEKEAVRVKTAQVYYPPTTPSDTAKVVALTVFGTIAVISLGALLFWFLQKDRSTNANVNVNTNLGAFNGNLGANNALDNYNFNSVPNYNANYGSSGNANTNFNTNFSVKTPVPSPSAKPSPSATPSPAPDDDPDATPTPRPSPRPAGSPGPPVSPTPRIGPRPTPNPGRTPNDQ